MKHSYSFILFFSVILLTFGFLAKPTFSQTYPNDLLIDEASASELLYNDDVVFVDMRSEGFSDGHIPGAVWFGGAPALVDTSHSIEHFLVDSSKFQSLMRMVGINRDSRVIIYDGGNSLAAARLFFALELNKHEDIQILNGGFAAWEAGGFSISNSSEVPTRGNFTSAYDDTRTCDVRIILEALDNENIVILDARSPEEYSGETVRAERGGHIPNAVNLEWRNFVEAEGVPYFRSAEEITEMLANIGITPEKQVITHCQTNVRGSHAYFTLRLMGYDSVRAYEGSWSEWGNRADTPVSN